MHPRYTHQKPDVVFRPGDDYADTIYVPDECITCALCELWSQAVAGKGACSKHSGNQLDCDGPSACEVTTPADGWCAHFELSDEGRQDVEAVLQEEADWKAQEAYEARERYRGLGVGPMVDPFAQAPKAGDLVHDHL